MTPRVGINSVQLQVTCEAITGHYYQKIQDHVTASALQNHIVRARQWQEEVLKSVDWDTYQQSKNRLNHRDSQIIKLTHGILPTANHIKKYDKLSSFKCTFCSKHNETCDHIMQCSSSHSSKW
eukprot:1387280-Ditylum_brightwellii.AAC.1